MTQATGGDKSGNGRNGAPIRGLDADRADGRMRQESSLSPVRARIAKAAFAMRDTPDLLNLFAELPAPGPQEDTRVILERPGLRLERIVSHGQASPTGFWYDQTDDEWVLLLRGAARLRLEGEAEDRRLAPGDHLLLPARRRHRVNWTDPTQPTVWLALFVPPETG